MKQSDGCLASRISAKKTSSKEIRRHKRERVFDCKIAELRGEYEDLSQYKLAKAVGISISTLCDIESGCGTSLDIAQRLAAAFGKSIDEVFVRKNPIVFNE